MTSIWYEQNEYALPDGEHLGSNLRAFFGVPKRKTLMVIATDGGPDIVIAPNLPYFLQNGDKFYSAKRGPKEGDTGK